MKKIYILTLDWANSAGTYCHILSVSESLETIKLRMQEDIKEDAEWDNDMNNEIIIETSADGMYYEEYLEDDREENHMIYKITEMEVI